MSVIKKNHAYFLPSTLDGYFSLFKIVSKKILLSLLVSFYAVANFAQSTTCDCDYYMYLNDVQGSGSGDGFVHKFRINPNGTFTEIFRNPPTNTVPWFPTGGGLPSPHGLAQDLNGNIYIGEGPFGDGAEDIRKLSCSGTLVPQATFKIDDGGYNFSSRNGIIYVNSAAASNRINAYRICDGSLIGYIRLSGVRNVDGTPQGDPGSPANEDWGFSIAPDGTFYATSGIGDYSGNGKTDRIFRFTPTLADFAAHTLYTSFITSASYPAGITDNEHETFGITSDPAGNMYVIVSDFNTSRRWILKFNSSGVLVDSNSELTSSPTGGFEGARGLAYHAPTNKLYVAGGQDGDCVAIINPATLNYEGPALANVPGQFPKGLAIVKECCPGTTPINVNENACYTGVSQNYFLSDFTSDCDAPLCAGGNAWTPASGNSSNLVFNACDNSVTVNGPGCGTFTLTNPGVGNACGAFQFTVNLCFNSPPTATVTPQQGTCTGSNPNNDAKINITAAINANQAGFSTGATYSGPAYNGVGTIPVAAGNASFTSLMHNTEYTVRIFNGANDCYVDYTVTTPTIDCNTVTSCNCKEYIYLNEPGLGAVLKFEVGAGVPLTELIGANGGTPPTEHWYPGLGATEMPRPHGLGSDLNGKLYIASDFQNPNEIRRLDCDGGIDPISATTVINPTNSVFNIFSIGNALYVTRNGGVASYNSCTGAKIGELCYNDALGNPNPGAYWGLSYNSVTKMIYGSGRLTDNRNIFVYSESEMEQAMLNGTSIDPFIPLGTTTLSNIMPGDNFIPSNISQIIGITSDDLGNIYIVGYEEGVTPTYGRILKYNSAGGFVGISPQVIQAQGSYGIIWSRDYNRLYVAQLNDNPIVDCISAFSTDLAYVGTAAPNPGLAVNNGGKALAIIKECCPINLPLTFQREVCGAIGTKFYLNEEAFDLCDGVVCGSSWTPTSVNNMTFDPCDNSVVVNGNGCSTFTLNIGAVSSTACGAQNATFTICNTVIDASVNTNVGTCGAFGANNNASIVISNILNVNQAGISVGNVYSGPAYGTAGTISITGGGTFPNLIHNTYYTVRIFNGSNECYFDKVILTPNISCCSANITALPTTCNPNNNQYAVSGQLTFVNPPASGTLTVSISGGGSQVFNAPFTSPINYTINGQTSDGLTKTVTWTFSVLLSCTNTTTYMAPSGCAPTGTCGCTEYIYLNEPEAQKVLKFRVGSNVPLTEIPGQGGGAWYPGSNASELPFPHGIATDLNGFLYIAETSQDGNIRKLNCDGDIFPVTGTTINDTGVHTNMFSIDNTLYVTGLGGPKAYDLCTGALIGQMCLITPSGNPVTGTPWGLSYNAVTETVYVSGLTGNRIWAFSRAQLEAGIAGTGPCIPPLIEQGPNATVNIGENFTPNAATGVFGVVGDDSGNIYVVESAVVGGTGTYLLKYDVNGFLLATSPVDNVLGGGGYYYGMGMVWSETSNRLYVSNRTNDLTEDCIAAFNASTMAYLGPGAPNPLTGGTSTSGKALGIIKECCPVNLPSSFTREVCGAVGTKFYLNQEAFNDCDGTVCGSSWTPTSLTGMTFDPCDNSVTVTGPGCGVFILDIGAVTSTSCPAQMSTFTICNLIPSGTVVGNPGTCNGATANNDARVNLSSVTNADQAGISLGATYTGPSYGGVGTINVSSGSGVFTNLTHNTTYTVRIYNGSGTCYVDRTVTTPVVLCCASTVTATPSACNPNNNQYTVSGQVTVTNGPATGTLTVSITGGSSQVFNAPFTSPISYSIGGQTSDGLVKTVTATFSAIPTCGNIVTYTAPSNCSPTGTCNCTEYVYLNEPNDNSVLKFKVSGPIALTEVVGSNGGPHWYPGAGISQIPGPHGLGTDLNGNLYIGASGINDYIRKLDCDGNLTPISGNSVFNPGTHQNIFSIDNTLYVNTDGGPSAYNLCTGALLGQLCLNGASGNLWGLSYNPVTQLVYASQRGGSHQVWVFTRAQLEAGIVGGPCINPIITLGPNAVVNPGENFLPNAPGGVFGVVGDNNGNIYVVKSAVDGGTSTYILKYNSAGQFISKTLDGICGSATTPYCFGIGVVWSEDTNRLYMSNLTDDPTVDCISAFDAGTMAYIGTAAPNPNLPTNSTGKAIAIIKECCPVNLPSAFQREVCGAVGTKFYLNEQAFNDCDGTVCGSSWTPSSLNGMTFDPCDNSVTVTGVGCSTFTLGIGAVASSGCGSQNSTFTICNNLPSASFTPLSGTCNASGPNNDVKINVVNATYANQAGISVGNTYTGPAYGGVGTISLAGGIGTFTGLMHVTAYTIRVFNGSNECFVDFQVNTPSLECCNIAAIVPLNITCYDNGTPGQITDNKIRFNANITNSNALLTSYNVTISGGTTITPNTNVPYGITQFTLGAGTAGSGSTFTITFTDSTTPGCTEVFTITDPGNCAPSVPLCPPVQCGTATIQVNGN